DVLVAELQSAGEVGMARTEPRYGIRGLGDRHDDHDALPVHGIAVQDLERDRPAGRAALADPAGDANLVALDLLPRAASVAAVPAAQIRIDVRRRHNETRWDPVAE